jgi:hypothetical protein
VPHRTIHTSTYTWYVLPTYIYIHHSGCFCLLTLHTLAVIEISRLDLNSYQLFLFYTWPIWVPPCGNMQKCCMEQMVKDLLGVAE